MNSEIFDLKLQGYCCSQIIMALGLKRLGKENDDLISAMAVLCNGLWKDKVCGVVSACICLLYLANPYEANKSHVAEFSEWFADAFGSMECAALLDRNPIKKGEMCPLFIEASFTKVKELLEW